MGEKEDPEPHGDEDADEGEDANWRRNCHGHSLSIGTLRPKLYP